MRIRKFGWNGNEEAQWYNFKNIYPILFELLDVHGMQCDQIGQFLKVLCDMVSIESSPIALFIFGLKWRAALFMLFYWGYFLGNFRKIGILFYVASGHTDGMGPK